MDDILGSGEKTKLIVIGSDQNKGAKKESVTNICLWSTDKRESKRVTAGCQQDGNMETLVVW